MTGTSKICEPPLGLADKDCCCVLENSVHFILQALIFRGKDNSSRQLPLLHLTSLSFSDSAISLERQAETPGRVFIVWVRFEFPSHVPVLVHSTWVTGPGSGNHQRAQAGAKDPGDPGDAWRRGHLRIPMRGYGLKGC